MIVVVFTSIGESLSVEHIRPFSLTVRIFFFVFVQWLPFRLDSVLHWVYCGNMYELLADFNDVSCCIQQTLLKGFTHNLYTFFICFFLFYLFLLSFLSQFMFHSKDPIHIALLPLHFLPNKYWQFRWLFSSFRFSFLCYLKIGLMTTLPMFKIMSETAWKRYTYTLCVCVCSCAETFRQRISNKWYSTFYFGVVFVFTCDTWMKNNQTK